MTAAKTPRKNTKKSTEKVVLNTPTVIIAADKIHVNDDINTIKPENKDLKPIPPSEKDADLILENQEEIIFKLDKLIKTSNSILINLEHYKSPMDSHLADLDLGIITKAQDVPHEVKEKRNKREWYLLFGLFVLMFFMAGLIVAKFINLI